MGCLSQRPVALLGWAVRVAVDAGGSVVAGATAVGAAPSSAGSQPIEKGAIVSALNARTFDVEASTLPHASRGACVYIKNLIVVGVLVEEISY